MQWVDYDGQDTTGYDYLGTDSIKYPITEDTDTKAIVDELVRRCGRFAHIKLFKEDKQYEAG